MPPDKYVHLVYTTQVNSTFHECTHLRAAEEKQNIVANKVAFWAASYSACNCVVYTKTIIHLGVGESGGYLPPLW